MLRGGSAKVIFNDQGGRGVQTPPKKYDINNEQPNTVINKHLIFHISLLVRHLKVGTYILTSLDQAYLNMQLTLRLHYKPRAGEIAKAVIMKSAAALNCLCCSNP